MEEFSLALFDIDSFKTINDSFGHLTGDAVLRSVADALRDGCRAYDVKARYGGDEFIVVMPYTHLDQGIAVAEKIRRAVAALELEVDGKPLHVTLSAGVTSTVGREGLTPESLIHRADIALYEAKKTGRNQTVPLKRGEAAAEVLIVEDDASDAEAMIHLCESLDCRADWACTGAEAELRVRDRRYVLALVDCSLPDVDGSEAIGRIRDAAPMTTTALVAGTDSASAKLIGTLGQSPVIVVRKPLSRDHLKAILTDARRRT